ncbi:MULTISPECIES: protease inhibitor I42 family protein [Legionella]|uniref:Proteinase inhibitor I42 chagasin domain-containing protein n=1 Tax=Legionella septentrionalis TaxID=2498109 RepID=A0A433JGG5_9GAMM|nr:MULTISPECIES: protease inhibitor I42 family protein [Legionella]MCP0913650.1 protease inhibitor I42 family protein [Legionella sp. 27cVA30]RUQ79183.1 hypothetical protein EKM59_11385 [Legionella septentrionalis]RUQ96324.1 hypothetical protein ELY11_08060 [Legionella septentrionalis]RUR09103.1 hypothetical protein ELY14_09820 [Legionella septentrionalis]RUR14164.1 hypothetical protein ELY10_09340 [Legionella septentrionalis]
MRTVIGSLLWICSLALYAIGAETLTLNLSASSREFVVKLPANPTTGYQWTIKKYNKNFFQLTSSQYVSPKTQLIGAGGEMVYVFKLKAGKSYPEKTHMLFKYARPWEPKSAILKKVVINFKS